jgi:hypothetical protein
LDGLDDRLDKIRADVLQLHPFPTIEQAYAHVQREDLRQMVMLSKADTSSSMAMISKGGQKSQQQPSLQMVINGKPGMKSKTQVEGGGCTHCGNMKHTKETCFKLHGYPDWWHEFKTKKSVKVVVLHLSALRALLLHQSNLTFLLYLKRIFHQQQQIIPCPIMNQVTTTGLLILGQLIT